MKKEGIPRRPNPGTHFLAEIQGDMKEAAEQDTAPQANIPHTGHAGCTCCDGEGDFLPDATEE